jgi:hypothetical protein
LRSTPMSALSSYSSSIGAKTTSVRVAKSFVRMYQRCV